MKRKKCLITGGTGFVGYNLVKELQKQDYEVVITGKSGENYKEIENLIIGYDLFKIDWDKIKKIDILFHQAAIVDTTIKNRAEMLHVNVEASKFIFGQAVKHDCANIVYASSTAVYGNEPAPYKENYT